MKAGMRRGRTVGVEAAEGSVLGSVAGEGTVPPGRAGAGEAGERGWGARVGGTGQEGFAAASQLAIADSITSAVRPAAWASSSVPGGR